MHISKFSNAKEDGIFPDRPNLHINADDIETEEERTAQYSRTLWLERSKINGFPYKKMRAAAENYN